MRTAVMLFGVAIFFVTVGAAFEKERLRAETPAQYPEGVVIRVLDVTIKDSNTTGRRQRFECRPIER